MTVRTGWGLRGWALWTAATAVVVAALVVSGGRTADAQTELVNFAAIGSAEGVRYHTVAAGAPLTDDVADVATPQAQSIVDSVSGSNAYAAVPYPGETVLTGPALATGAAGLPAAPAYPVLASSSHPFEPEEDIEQPGVRIRASSDATSSRAAAITGGSSAPTGIGRATTTSVSTLEQETGRLRAEAVSSAEVISVEGLLRIGRVEGTAAASLVPGEPVERSADLVVGDVTVAGQSARITPQGVVVGDRASALPVGPQVDLLEEAGIGARLLAPIETEDGIVSGALEITVVTEGPSGPVTQTYTFGRASARVSSQAASPLGGGVPTAPAPVAASGEGDGPGTSMSDARVPDTPAAQNGAASADQPTPRDTEAGTTSPVLQAQPVANAFPLTDTVSFYLTIVLAALVVFGAAQLVRIMGVRSAWIS